MTAQLASTAAHRSPDHQVSAPGHRVSAQAQRPLTNLTAPNPTVTNTAVTDRRGSAKPALSINSVLAVLLAALIVLAFVGFGGDAAANGPLQPASERSSVLDTIEVYVVQPGDTLWSIATAVSVEGEDIRPLVDHLKSVAGGSALDVGQRIVIDHATMRS